MSLIISLMVLGSNAQSIINYGKYSVSKNEFLRAYTKNQLTITDKEKSLRDYIKLYTNFKLKVKAAEELRIDTLEQIKYDVANFRNQIMDNYLVETKALELLEDEAFERSKVNVRTTYYSVNAVGTDSVKAAAAIQKLYNSLSAGNVSNALLEQNGVTINKQNLGYVGVFNLPYAFENIVYNTKPGMASKPYKSKTTWHIFKVEDIRPASGKWRIAQILFSLPADADEATRAAIKKKADSVHRLLLSGVAFAGAAMQYSDDKLTYTTGGEMPEFSSGKYNADFEAQVFKLNSDGAFTAPFTTNFGYHIVKRIQQTPVVTNKNDAANRYDLKQKIIADDRMAQQKENFVRSIVAITGYKLTGLVSDKELYRNADSLMRDPSIENTLLLPVSKKAIATFKNGEKVTGADWLKYVREYRSNVDGGMFESNSILLTKFKNYAPLAHYKANLESYNDDFKYQVKEFKEGNMLFEVMERKVWTKATTSEEALQKFYTAQKDKYKWATSADVLVVNCSTAALAKSTMAALQQGASWQSLVDQANATINIDSGRHELEQIIEPQFAGKVATGSFSNIITNSDGTSAFVKYISLYKAGEQKSFLDARGLVISDYQNLLEEEWMQTMRKKYPVIVNESVVKQLLQ